MVAEKRKDDVTTKLLSTFKQLLSEGALAPGQRLPAEREMASTLNVSRGSLRQALKMLEVMGVVSQRVGDGTYLNRAAPAILAEPMEFLVLLHGISFEELMDARIIVEPELAARAAEHAKPETIAFLRESLRRMQSGSSASDGCARPAIEVSPDAEEVAHWRATFEAQALQDTSSHGRLLNRELSACARARLVVPLRSRADCGSPRILI